MSGKQGVHPIEVLREGGIGSRFLSAIGFPIPLGTLAIVVMLVPPLTLKADLSPSRSEDL
jgi:hypothetical protein